MTKTPKHKPPLTVAAMDAALDALGYVTGKAAADALGRHQGGSLAQQLTDHGVRSVTYQIHGRDGQSREMRRFCVADFPRMPAVRKPRGRSAVVAEPDHAPALPMQPQLATNAELAEMRAMILTLAQTVGQLLIDKE